MKLRMALALPAVLLISSCQTWAPTWSEVSGRMYNLPPPSFNDAPTSVQNIDGNGAFPDGPLMPIKITPGKHQLLLAAAPLSKWPGGTNLENFTLDAEPCVRYYINGRYDTRLGLDWTPYIGYKESIPGCTVPGK